MVKLGLFILGGVNAIFSFADIGKSIHFAKMYVEGKVTEWTFEALPDYCPRSVNRLKRGVPDWREVVKGDQPWYDMDFYGKD